MSWRRPAAGVVAVGGDSSAGYSAHNALAWLMKSCARSEDVVTLNM